jgi:hypothetical protein
MSEPCSLFARIKIATAQFEAFLKAEPEQPVLDSNWMEMVGFKGDVQQIAPGAI